MRGQTRTSRCRRSLPKFGLIRNGLARKAYHCRQGLKNQALSARCNEINLPVKLSLSIQISQWLDLNYGFFRLREEILKAPLPIIEGVAPSKRRLPAGGWKTVLEFLHAQYPQIAPEIWRARMAAGEITDETAQRITPDSAYRAGACIFYYREIADEPEIPFTARVLYRDEHLLVADKPHFLPVMPAGRFLRETLLIRLRREFQLEDIAPLHRLDRETAGVVLFSVNPASRGRYVSLFQQRAVRKIYEALAPALRHVSLPLMRRSRITPGELFFRMREIAGTPNAETLIESAVLQTEHTARYRLLPVTGKKHQLRLHLAALGAPIINDMLYPDFKRTGPDENCCPLKLLARSIAFRNPLDGREHYFESQRSLTFENP